ncbi:MAG TPA: type IV pilus twitching motility protein PilT [Acidimicrobiia bacterium]|nr:type IV pilus twitching motility protein PilT [Acidimicrobiia bacterium]
MSIDHSPIQSYLDAMIELGASDLMLTANTPTRARVDGQLRPLPGERALTDEEVEQRILTMLSPGLREEFREKQELDFSFSYDVSHRFRGNCFFQRGVPALSLRALPTEIPDFESLHLPPVCEYFCNLPQGLVLVTGPTGSGKSTTLASMIDFINTNRECHILTIEDPIEFVHQHKTAVVNQRQVGDDTSSFAGALRAALREDPDVILVGEMRDPETIQFALTLAETGHLVFATLHTNDAAQSLDRVWDVFPHQRQAQVRVQLSASLAGIISQRLVRRTTTGVVAAFEVLVATPAVRNIIREGNTHQLRNIIHGGRAHGMITLEASLAERIDAGLISIDEALTHTLYPNEVDELRRSA